MRTDFALGFLHEIFRPEHYYLAAVLFVTIRRNPEGWTTWLALQLDGAT